ncbi:MAG: hypothetical protein E7321_03795 [Clostridiales bacterium]|nr:hypothetical protein [Clostridiales bacterium]
MRLPLTQWLLEAEHLPERLFSGISRPSFSLPGADQLLQFADLIGGEEETDETKQKAGVPYALQGCFEDDLAGELTLKKEIDFGAFEGERALITFEQIAGSGEILLGGRVIAKFDSDANILKLLRHAQDSTGLPCRLAVDVSDALLLGRSETLELRFSAARPAGVCGAAFLNVPERAHLSRVSIQPDTIRRTMTVRARVHAHAKGRYVLRVQAVPGEAGAQVEPARETDMTLDAGEETSIELSLAVDAPAFIPGKAYAAPALKIQLFFRGEKQRGEGLLCDDALLLCGYGAGAPRAYLPLRDEDCLGDVDALCEKLSALHVPGVMLAAPAPDGLYRALSRAGIPAVQHMPQQLRPAFTRYPCLHLADRLLNQDLISLEAAAWQMAASVAFPRAIDETISPDEMLLDVSGRRLDHKSVGVRDTLKWLRVVQIRLRAEAARQGRYQGALCSAEDIQSSDVCDALRTAFSPVHLSALPLSGAWWTGTRFSASLEAFFPQKTADGRVVYAVAVLEDEKGRELACTTASCTKSGYAGVIEAQLPDDPCVLMLHCMLLRSGEVIEENMLPIYVGQRGPLEAAF